LLTLRVNVADSRDYSDRRYGDKDTRKCWQSKQERREHRADNRAWHQLRLAPGGAQRCSRDPALGIELCRTSNRSERTMTLTAGRTEDFMQNNCGTQAL